ncbi:MAG: hypothetical protein ACXABY_36255 [Candidatus Thorarchaeota archaeon]
MITYETALDRLDKPRRQDQKWWFSHLYLRRDGKNVKVSAYKYETTIFMILHPDGSVTLWHRKWREGYIERNPHVKNITNHWLNRDRSDKQIEIGPCNWINKYTPKQYSVHMKQVDWKWIISINNTQYLYKAGMRIYPSGRVTRAKLLKEADPGLFLKVNGGMLKNPRQYLEVKGISPESEEGKKIMGRAFRARVEGRI